MNNHKLRLLPLFILITGLVTLTAGCKKKDMSLKLNEPRINPEKPDVPLNKNDAFQKVQKRRVQEKR